jgi:hypothetical protein
MAPASSDPSTTKELATKCLMNTNQREDYKSSEKKKKLQCASSVTNNLGKYKLSNNTKFVNHHY